MKYKDKNYSTRVNGVYPAYQEAENFSIGEGRFISEFDIEQASRVIAIGVRVKDALFGKKMLWGRTLSSAIISSRLLESWKRKRWKCLDGAVTIQWIG